MNEEKEAVLYKKQLAIIVGREEAKTILEIAASKGELKQIKVREKDYVPLACVKRDFSLSSLKSAEPPAESEIAEAHALLLSEISSLDGGKIDFASLCSIVSSFYSAEKCYAFFCAFLRSEQFTMDEKAFQSGKIEFFVNTPEEIEKKRQEARKKEEEEKEKEDFALRLKERRILETDGKFMKEIEMAALGQTDKSPLMKMAGIPFSSENAHRILLESGVWDSFYNPYPERHGFTFSKSVKIPPPSEEEERFEVESVAYAIDSESSVDPDDAVSFDGEYLWVHVADPASVIEADSAVDREARNRASTLYLPDKVMRLLDEKALDYFALGKKEKSKALSFRIKVNDEGEIENVSVMKTLVKVKCLTYEEAFRRKEEADLSPLFRIASLSEERRRRFGAILVNMNEVHVKVTNGKVEITPLENNEAVSMVRELMIKAGEAAAEYAFSRSIPFPFISQETSQDVPLPVTGGLAGEFALLKGAGKRSVSTQVAYHAGLALSMYTQVTSPLRRYIDLIAHQQLRAHLDGRALITREEMFQRINASEMAYTAAKKAMRESEMHFKLVYLIENPSLSFKAICIDRRDKDAILYIPSLGMRTLLSEPSLKLNDEITVSPSKIELASLKAVFRRVS